MKKILRNRTVLGIACIVLSLIICFGLTPLFNRVVSEKVSVIQVTGDIQRGELIPSNKVKKVEVGGYNLPPSIIKNEANIVGKYAKADLHVGDYILSTKISESPLVNYEYLTGFDGAQRAISVSVKSLAAGLSGKLEAGDIVSVLATDFGDLRETITPEELKYVEVLAVTVSNGLDTNEYEKDPKRIESEKELPATITLKVTDAQAKRLAEMEAKGKIHMVFVFRGERENADKFLEEQERILTQNNPYELENSELPQNAESTVETREVETTNEMEEAVYDNE